MPDGEPIVVDASVAAKASLTNGFGLLEGYRLLAPSLIWSEVAAALGQLAWRGDISTDEADAAVARLLAVDLEITDSRSLIGDAVLMARRLGWAKTYDAEYVVLAQRAPATFVTLDARLHATATRLVATRAPDTL